MDFAPGFEDDADELEDLFGPIRNSKAEPNSAMALVERFRATPESSEEFSTHDVAPEQAESAYNDMRRNVGRSWGGGEVRELGDGRIGFSSPAGAFAMAPPAEAESNWRVLFTIKTGIVRRAVNK